MLLKEREQLYTAEEFWDITQLPENENRRLELEDGVVVEMASSRVENTITAGRIIHFLNAFVIPRDLGYVTAPDGGFKLAPKRVRQPDTAFISKARYPHPKGVQIPVAPDLAVEVASPKEDVFKKVNEYLRAGTRIVWAVYVDEKTVYVCRLDDDGNLISTPVGIDGTLDGGEVLLGLTLPVRDIFPT